MADLLREDGADIEARVISAHQLLHEFREADREHILERLNSRMIEDVERSAALRQAAAARLAAYERRSGWDRRSGRERRAALQAAVARANRRSGDERRSGRDRRTGGDRPRPQQPQHSGIR